MYYESKINASIKVLEVILSLISPICLNKMYKKCFMMYIPHSVNLYFKMENTTLEYFKQLLKLVRKSSG